VVLHGGSRILPGRNLKEMKFTDADDHFLLHSPYLFDQAGLRLDDQISLQEDGRFILHGRLDRIVKIEEKRCL